MTLGSLATLVTLAAALLPTAQALAGGSTIKDDSFVLDVTIDDGSGGTITAGPFSAIAKAEDAGYLNAELNADFSAGNTDYNIRVNWLDADSFDLYLTAYGAIDLYQLSVKLSDLDFATAGVPDAIIGAAFNRGASNVDDFDAGPSMPNPTVSFTDRSVTADFSYFPGDLAADPTRLRFDVQTAVPEPGSLALLLGGLGLLALTRRLQTRGQESAATHA